MKYRCAGCGAEDRTHPEYCEWCGERNWDEMPDPGDEDDEPKAPHSSGNSPEK